MAVADEIAREELRALQEQGLSRELTPQRTAPGVEIELRPGERLLNFSSNDYLGLAGDARVARALAEGAGRWGAGASASRLVVGDFEPHHELERAVAELEGAEAALLFGSGYAANSGLFAAFVGQGD